MKAKISRRASYDYIIVDAEFIETENGRVDLNEPEWLETGDDKTLRTGHGTQVFTVEDWTAKQVIAIANGVEICGECHKLENTPYGTPNLCDPCECEPKPEKDPYPGIVGWISSIGPLGNLPKKHIFVDRKYGDKWVGIKNAIPVHRVDWDLGLMDAQDGQYDILTRENPTDHIIVEKFEEPY